MLPPPPQIVALQFRPRHRTKLHSTKPIERLNGEIKRRMTEVVGILPNEDGIVGLVGANQLEQNDESWKSSSSEDSLPA